MTRNRKYVLATGIGLLAIAAAATAFAVSNDNRAGRDAAYDLNRDGTISLAEVRQVGQRQFEVLDVDKNGAISGAELPLMIQTVSMHSGGIGRPGFREDGRNHQSAERSEISQQPSAPRNGEIAPPQPVGPLPLDFNGDGSVQSAEFIAGFAAPFALKDFDGNGTLSAEEMRSGGHDGGGRRGHRH